MPASSPIISNSSTLIDSTSRCGAPMLFISATVSRCRET
jgi:hypothetical protein